MTDHMTMPLDDFAAAILEDGIVDADEVTKIRERLYADDVIDREEADFLFKINDAVTGKENDPGWCKLFIDAMCDHVLKDETSPGVIDEDEANFLIEKIKGDEQVDGTELALLVAICERATGESPEVFTDFVLDSVKNAVILDGIVDADEVAMIKKVIYGAGGSAGAAVDDAEAKMIFDINDAVSGKTNDPGWKDLFVEAISKWCLEDDVSPGVIDDREAEILHTAIYADGQVDDIEKALIAELKAKAKDPIPGKINFLFEMFG